MSALFERSATPGAVWAVGDRGLYRIDGDAVRALDGVSILPDPEASINDVAYDPGTDRLFLATTRGLVAVDLGAAPPSATRPQVALTSVTVDGRVVRLRGTPVRARIDPLRPGTYRVEVNVASPTFASDALLETRYDGGAWRPVGRRRQIAFADLGHGEHVVEVRARTVGGTASRETARLTVAVQPFWWQRPGVVVTLAILLLAAFAVGVRALSLRRLRRRLLDAERRTVAERRVRRERERISRDLHDHVGAQLASLLAGVELARLSGAAQTSALDPIEADARATIGQLRETIWALHGESLSASAFCDRLTAFARTRSRGHAATVHVDCEIDASVTLPPEVALGLYRVAQEGVSNALKHADATQISVVLSGAPGSLRLTVRDDGTFQEPVGGDGLSGFGLGSMEARAVGLGGTFRLSTADGTCVTVEVPSDVPTA